MRSQPQETARQLRSVALRYRAGGSAQRLSGLTTSGRCQFFGFATSSRATGQQDSTDERLQRLEATLFLTREPLNARKLSQYAGLADGTEARTLVRHLNQHYDQSGSAFRVESVAGGYQLLTRPLLAPWLRRLDHIPSDTRLSAPALETLAVVAYRQPVLRVDIEAIRGVSCGEILRQLIERDLVRIGGRSEELGRPYLYATTKRFLRTFGLRDLQQLPRAESLRLAPVSASNTEIEPIEVFEQNAEDSDHTQQEDP